MDDAGMGWTDERVERLKQLWANGLSASQIAAEIGGISRNAVIGKVHRLGLSGRAKTGQEPQQPVRARKDGEADGAASLDGATALNGAEAAEPGDAIMLTTGQTGDEPSLPEPRREEVVVALSQRVTIMDLRESMCRWPIGDPTSPEFRFCGGRSITGLPYCPHHAQIAYQPVADRRRDRRVGGGRL